MLFSEILEKKKRIKLTGHLGFRKMFSKEVSEMVIRRNTMDEELIYKHFLSKVRKKSWKCQIL